ncbi:thioredoxin family protein [Nocardia sp. XZ_19_369]|uniref:thioredoxin family protein n=1 Tax=Nocardia sp. XZ_19_369 TaxID=2769487 RepID=UPI00188E6025|nr:thioredoxin family protein [Nocardia sp. XZ_19_369]
MAVSSIRTEAEYYAFQASKQIVVVHFHAEWSAPSNAIRPKYEGISRENGDVACGEVDVDRLGDLAAQEQATAVPTFFVYVAGERFATVAGGNESELKQRIAEARTKVTA